MLLYGHYKNGQRNWTGWRLPYACGQAEHSHMFCANCFWMLATNVGLLLRNIAAVTSFLLVTDKFYSNWYVFNLCQIRKEMTASRLVNVDFSAAAWVRVVSAFARLDGHLMIKVWTTKEFKRRLSLWTQHPLGEMIRSIMWPLEIRGQVCPTGDIPLYYY